MWKKIAIAVAVIVVLLIIAYEVTKSSAPAPPTSIVCAGGAYSDNSAIRPADAQAGSVVCGGGNRFFTCQANGVWALGGGSCSPGMWGIV